MDVVFVAGVAVISAEPESGASFYRGTLGLPLEGDDYLSTNDLGGVKHFGIWPLADAARSCFGTDTWPADVPVPQAVIEFEVAAPDAVADAAAELTAAGYEVLREAFEEPWGQIVTRVLSPEGIVVGLSYTPWFHDAAQSE